MVKTELTREQSQHLIDLGVPKEKASSVEQIPDYDNPIFTLTDLLDLLPKRLENAPAFTLFIAWRWDNKIIAHYDNGRGFPVRRRLIRTELIDALYDAACWYYGEYLKSEKK